jgi:hypothetical protein
MAHEQATMKRLVLDAGYSEVEWVEKEIREYRLGEAIRHTKVEVAMNEDGEVLVTLTGPYRYEFKRFAAKFFNDKAIGDLIVEEQTVDL